MRAKARMTAATVSLLGGVLLLAVKFVGFWMTDSQAVFSDAMESIVNVLAAGAALVAVWLASQPADENHPYGHGKVEFMTGGFEGGLIAFAAVVIVHQAIFALLEGAEPRRLGVGMAVIAGAGVANLVLGLYLVRTGRRHGSPALVADGEHVMSDFWTSAGAVLGLVLVKFTGLAWIDPVTAIVVALKLLWTGLGLVREAMRGLMDEADPARVAKLAEALDACRSEGIIEVHELRAIAVGGHHHVDAHVVVPEFWSVERAHDEMDAYSQRVLERLPHGGDLQLHVDPCERAYCRFCEFPQCPVRVEPFETRRAFDPEHAVRGPRPDPGRTVHE